MASPNLDIVTPARTDESLEKGFSPKIVEAIDAAKRAEHGK